jgi:glycosyltransferase involved in cell wall biosynthesis
MPMNERHRDADAGAPSPRVLLLLPGLWRGGAEARACALAAGLKARGWTVDVAALLYPFPGDKSVLPELRSMGIKPLDLGYGGVRQPAVWPRSIRAWWRLRNALAATKPDILHAFLPSGNIFAAGTLATTFSKSPRLVLGREGLPTYRKERPWLGVLEDWATRQAAATLCVCDAILRASNLDAKECKLQTILNGIETERFAATAEEKAAARADLAKRFPDHAPRWATGRLGVVVANLIPYKGHADILRALARHVAANEGSGLSFAFVGADLKKHQAALEQQADYLRVRDRVLFVGGVDDARPYLRAADFFLSSSHEEGLSLAILEAMATGLPILATTVGGTPEILDKAFALGFPPSDPDAMAGALAVVDAATPEELAQRGEAAARAARERFHATRMIDETERLYRELMAR